MKNVIQWAEIIVGFIIFLGGLLTYGFGIHDIVPVSRPDLIVVGTTLIGILIIVSGVCGFLLRKSKEQKIEENDERNIAIVNAAGASAFLSFSLMFSAALFALIFTGYMNKVSCFTFIGVFFIGQVIFISRLLFLQKTM